MRVLVLFFLSALCLTANAQSLKIGFIDTEQVIVNLTQYKNSVDKLSREFEPKKQELLDLFKHIELLRANIENFDGWLSGELVFQHDRYDRIQTADFFAKNKNRKPHLRATYSLRYITSSQLWRSSKFRISC
mgnify:CR=1 FL=1